MAAATASHANVAPEVFSCTVTFSIRAKTDMGDRLLLVGGGEALGNWNPADHGLELTTTEKDYPLWKSKQVRLHSSVALPLAEYKYVRLTRAGKVQWEFDGKNRCLPAECSYASMLVDDGHFGTLSEFCAFPEGEEQQKSLRDSFNLQPAHDGLRLVVLGDGAAAGSGAPGYNGWAAGLGKLLRDKFGYGYTNLSDALLTAEDAMRLGLSSMLPKPVPQVVVIAFSLELHSLTRCSDSDRGKIVDSTTRAFDTLVQQAWRLGIRPVLAGLCPNNAFGKEQAQFLQEMDAAMKGLGVPVLDWLPTLLKSSESGNWGEKLASSDLYPNAAGHQRMLSAIDISVFDPITIKDILTRLSPGTVQTCFSDGKGLEIKCDAGNSELLLSNLTDKACEFVPEWAEMQASLCASFTSAPWLLRRGLYVSCSQGKKMEGPLSVFIGAAGRFESNATIPAGCTHTLRHVSLLTDAKAPSAEALFLDGSFSILKTGNTSFTVCNSAAFEYNVHPMWDQVRQALKAMPHGVYEDTSGLPFRTAVISCHGLQSRMKAPARSAIELRHIGDLKSLEQVAVLPLGDRCSVRMLMHKIEFDGPCFPFDLTRTTSLADTVDMVATEFKDMWNPEYLCVDSKSGRIYHRKWGGLSFAHEVDWEAGDDPVRNFKPIALRMQKRYSNRAARFEWACKHAARVLFIRTGRSSRGEVTDLFARMRDRYPGLKFSLLLISDQAGHEFDNIEDMKHVRDSFDPDRMHKDLQYWEECAIRFRLILESIGVDAKSLYWCPSDVTEAAEELRGANICPSDVKDAVEELQGASTCTQSSEASNSACPSKLRETKIKDQDANTCSQALDAGRPSCPSVLKEAETERHPTNTVPQKNEAVKTPCFTNLQELEEAKKCKRTFEAANLPCPRVLEEAGAEFWVANSSAKAFDAAKLACSDNPQEAQSSLHASSACTQIAEDAEPPSAELNAGTVLVAASMQNKMSDPALDTKCTRSVEDTKPPGAEPNASSVAGMPERSKLAIDCIPNNMCLPGLTSLAAAIRLPS